MLQKIKIQEMTVPEDVGFGTRVETGPVEFTYPDGKTDWPGIFLRGDDCMRLQMKIFQLKNCIEEIEKGEFGRNQITAMALGILDEIKNTIGTEWRE